MKSEPKRVSGLHNSPLKDKWCLLLLEYNLANKGRGKKMLLSVFFESIVDLELKLPPIMALPAS